MGGIDDNINNQMLFVTKALDKVYTKRSIAYTMCNLFLNIRSDVDYIYSKR